MVRLAVTAVPVAMVEQADQEVQEMVEPDKLVHSAVLVVLAVR
jgi:hypothetical protein